MFKLTQISRLNRSFSVIKRDWLKVSKSSFDLGSFLFPFRSCEASSSAVIVVESLSEHTQ